MPWLPPSSRLARPLGAWGLIRVVVAREADADIRGAALAWPGNYPYAGVGISSTEEDPQEWGHRAGGDKAALLWTGKAGRGPADGRQALAIERVNALQRQVYVQDHLHLAPAHQRPR